MNPYKERILKENDHFKRTMEGNQSKQKRDNKENTRRIQCIEINN